MLDGDTETIGLSPRERDIVALIGNGYSYTEIAKVLGLGEKTVRNYTTEIFRKLGARSRTQVAVWAFRHGIR